MEFIDIYDDLGQKSGKSEEKSVGHFFFRACSGW